MKQQDTVFSFFNRTQRNVFRTAVAAVIVAIGTSANGASVVSRGSAGTARPTVSRANNAESRMPTINTRTQSISGTQTNTTPQAPNPQPAPEPTPVPEPEPEPDLIIENKASQFDTSLSASSTSTARDANADNLAEMIQRQRAALDARDASDAATSAVQTSLATGQSACDIGLRSCMKQKCGDDYSKCAGDGDTAWGDKMDTCRRGLNCTGKQYTLFAAEIKADRDMNAKLSSYTKIIDCGNEYNDCIVKQCGINYSKCLGKTAGDAAISACATIAKNCTQQDSGMASRTMNVFATLRQDAEKEIVKDEQRLYQMRDQMRAQCQRMGALFDERSLICVYTVNFFAGNASTPTASKKAYAGSSFNCTPDWFGIDVTTFKENAYRYTRSQTGASSALMGSGLGVGVGAVTSGMIDRAIDRKKANNALNKAKKEHEENYGDKQAATDTENQSGQQAQASNTQPINTNSTDTNTNDTNTGTPVQVTDTTSQSGETNSNDAPTQSTSALPAPTVARNTAQPKPRAYTEEEMREKMSKVVEICESYNKNGVIGKFVPDSQISYQNKFPYQVAYCIFLKPSPNNGGKNDPIIANSAEKYREKLSTFAIDGYVYAPDNRQGFRCRDLFKDKNLGGIPWHGQDLPTGQEGYYTACRFSTRIPESNS